MFKQNKLAVDFLLLVLLSATASVFFSRLDPDEMRALAIFPWDSGVYRDLAGKLLSSGFGEIKAEYPFGPRILFPIVYGGLHEIFDISYITSAYLLNISSAIVVIIFCFFYWRSNGVSRSLSWIGAALYLLYWNGPLRYSGIYPGGGFAFESLIVIVLFVSLAQLQTRNVLILSAALLAIFAISAGREFVTYIVTMVVAARLVVALFSKEEAISTHSGRSEFTLRAIKSLESRGFCGLLAALSLALAGYYLSRVIVSESSSGSYSVLRNIMHFGWFHLHFGEFFYAFFYALGPFFLCPVLLVFFPGLRSKYVAKLSTDVKDLDLVLIFCLAGIAFSRFGGTDSDRFLLWFFPFLGLFGLKAASMLLAARHRRINVSLGIVLIAGLLWTRFYVPAAPHLFFPGNYYGSQAGVKTNYDPLLYYGPPLLQNYRLQLKEIPFNQTYTNEITRDIVNEVADRPVFVPETVSRIGSGQSLYSGAYKHSINNIPFPFGFSHNQFELLVAHPVHGHPMVRLLLLAQWLGLLSLLIVINWRERKYVNI